MSKDAIGALSVEELEQESYRLQREEDAIKEQKRAVRAALDEKILAKRALDALVGAGLSVDVAVAALKLNSEAKIS